MARRTNIIWPDAYLEAWDGIRQIDDAYQTGNLRQHISELLNHARNEIDDGGESDTGAAEESTGDSSGG